MLKGFWTQFTKAKVSNALDSVGEALIKSDLNSATQAQMETYYNKLREVSEKVVQYQKQYDDEVAESKTLKESYNKRIDIANVLQKNAEKAETDKEKDSINNSLSKVIAEIKELKSQIDDNDKELSDIKSILDSWTSTRDLIKEKLDNAKTNIDKAQSRIAKAQAQAERSKELLSSSREQAGLKDKSSKDLEYVLDTMNDIAKKAENESLVNTSLSESLVPKKIDISEDENIKKATLELDGKSPATSLKDVLKTFNKL